MMKLVVYNTLTKTKEPFIPLEAGKVKMYVCGVTVYDLCHIGHARSAVVFDVIYRYLSYLGYEVTYVRNFTDIDDKIIRRAQEEGSDYHTIAERYIEAFYHDMDRLGIRHPTWEPRATEHIAEMQDIIRRLVEKGYAYQAGRDVYFSVERFDGYGKLSGRDLQDMMAGARVEVDEQKRNPFDFVLWKGSKEGEPAWESPWGAGRPGWHIECSAMGRRYLGETFDIHGGGKDLIFPHHENEIAQSEAAFEKPFARYWLHNGFVNVNNEKMSKSLGNFFTIRDILSTAHPEALRLFVLSKHYRSPVDFSDEAIKEAERGLERLYLTLAEARERFSSSRDEESPSPSRALLDTTVLQPLAADKKLYLSADPELYEKVVTFPERFTDAMNNDFNTAHAMGVLFDLRNALQRCLEGTGRKKLAPHVRELLRLAILFMHEAGTIFGILEKSPEEFWQEQHRRRLAAIGMTEEEVEQLITRRAEARKAKHFEEADRIRAMLAEKSIVLEDTPRGTRWRIEG